MIVIKRVKRLDDTVHDVTIESDSNIEIDAEGRLLMLPALIDPHVHFRTPGFEYKENWITGAKAAIHGGITTVFDMPNNNPPCCSVEAFTKKKEEIDRQLAEAEIPLRYYLYLGDGKDSLDALGKLRKKFIALKTYMGSPFGNMEERGLDEVFRRAAQENVVLAVHLENYALVEENKKHFPGHEQEYTVHSKIYTKEVAVQSLEKALELSEKYKTEILVLQVSTKEELDIIRKAKKSHLMISCEVTPHHLFLTENDYYELGTILKVVPPLRSQEDQDALWEGIRDGTVDFIGSAHSPHTLEDKYKPYYETPSGVPEIETMLPLLLNAYHEKKISLDKIVQITHLNIENMFVLPRNFDAVLVDLDLEKEVNQEDLQTKCKWSPYAGKMLKGWPVYTIVQGKVFDLRKVN